MTVSRPAPGIVLLFTALVVDGFDTAVLGVAVPSIAVEWRLATADFTPPLVLTGVGAIIGILISAPLTRRWGEVNVVWVSLLFFGLAMPATVYTVGIGQLSAARLITGIGLGTVLPAAVSLAGDMHPQRPQSAAMFLVLGLVTGNVLAGILSGRGIAVEKVPLALAAMTAGGLLGGGVVACLGSRRRASLGQIALLSLAGVAMALSPITSATVTGAALTLGVVGAGLVAGGAGVAGIAVTLYPRDLRTLGVGFAASATRLGAIAGPAVGGAVLQASSPATTLAEMAIPVLVAAVLFVGITRRTDSDPPSPSTYRATLAGADHRPNP